MKEKASPSHLTHAELDVFPSSPFPSPRSPQILGLSACESLPDDSASLMDGDFVDLFSSSEDEDFQEILEDSEPLKPFAGYGSYRQRHGDFSRRAARITRPGSRSGLSREAPATLGSYVGGCSQTDERKTPLSSLKADSCNSHAARRSFSTDLDRDEAWERKRDMYLVEGEVTDFTEETHMRAVGRSSSDCGNEAWPRPSSNSLPRGRARSLTDEDLEELRGSIDLGFGFSYDESCDLKRTLPALELYYAINRQFADSKSRSSPVSPLDGTALLRTSSGDSALSPSNETWRVSSPGDHPSQVKTRLRHWAQAVACSVKQGF